MRTLRPDRDFIVRTLADLVRINSVNPSIAADGAGEREIVEYISEVLGRIGLAIERVEPQEGRPSVVATLRGTGGGRSLMLNGHVDTVGVEGMPSPFAAEVRGSRMFGRGTHDMKGSLAACIGAAKALVEAGASLRGDFLIAGVADEEYGSLGTAAVIERRPVDAAIVAEPTNLEICLAHKGYAWVEVETRGRAAHGSRFTEGVDANMRMGRYLAQLDQLEQRLRSSAPHPLVGPPSLHAALLSGGSGMSTYAAASRLTVERRTIPGETVGRVVAELEGLVERLRAADPAFEASVRLLFAREPWEVAPDATIVRVLRAASEPVLGRAPRFVGDTPWMDAALLAAAGVETVVMGPTGAGEHSIEEWVDLDSVVQMAEILARTAVVYCN